MTAPARSVTEPGVRSHVRDPGSPAVERVRDPPRRQPGSRGSEEGPNPPRARPAPAPALEDRARSRGGSRGIARGSEAKDEGFEGQGWSGGRIQVAKQDEGEHGREGEAEEEASRRGRDEASAAGGDAGARYYLIPPAGPHDHGRPDDLLHRDLRLDRPWDDLRRRGRFHGRRGGDALRDGGCAARAAAVA